LYRWTRRVDIFKFYQIQPVGLHHFATEMPVINTLEFSRRQQLFDVPLPTINIPAALGVLFIIYFN